MPRPFPPIEGDSLLDQTIQLPADLEGRARLVLVAFKQRQQIEVNTWISVAEAMERDLAGFRYIEVPMLPRPFSLIAGFTANGMRSGITSDAARERTITVYTDRARFLREAGLTGGTDTIYALLLDASGQIVWQAEGATTDGSIAGLHAAVRAVLGTPAA